MKIAQLPRWIAISRAAFAVAPSALWMEWRELRDLLPGRATHRALRRLRRQYGGGCEAPSARDEAFERAWLRRDESAAEALVATDGSKPPKTVLCAAAVEGDMRWSQLGFAGGASMDLAAIAPESPLFDPSRFAPSDPLAATCIESVLDHFRGAQMPRGAVACLDAWASRLASRADLWEWRRQALLARLVRTVGASAAVNAKAILDSPSCSTQWAGPTPGRPWAVLEERELAARRVTAAQVIASFDDAIEWVAAHPGQHNAAALLDQRLAARVRVEWWLVGDSVALLRGPLDEERVAADLGSIEERNLNTGLCRRLVAAVGSARAPHAARAIAFAEPIADSLLQDFLLRAACFYGAQAEASLLARYCRHIDPKRLAERFESLFMPSTGRTQATTLPRGGLPIDHCIAAMPTAHRSAIEAIVLAHGPAGCFPATYARLEAAALATETQAARRGIEGQCAPEGLDAQTDSPPAPRKGRRL